MCLLCRLCFSDEYLLSSCPRITQTKKIQVAKHVLEVESISSKIDERCESLDAIQEFDERCNECKSIMLSDFENESNEINFTSLKEDSTMIFPDPNYSHTFQVLRSNHIRTIFML